jgi:hypothetical protein
VTHRIAHGLATAVAAAACLTATSGCNWIVQQIPDAPTPSPVTPTSIASESAQERTMRLDKEAAQNAYLVGWAESDRLLMAGGTDNATKKLTDNLGGSYLRDTVETLQQAKAYGWHSDRPTPTRVTADQGWSATRIGLTACEDNTDVQFFDKSGKEVNKKRDAYRIVQSLVAKKVDGRWKVDSQTSRPVKTFDNEAGCS